ncbi:MAG: YtxH protein [Chitinophagaceae bacterium]|nr:YtxH protein [Chitinophagaceae bacterium]
MKSELLIIGTFTGLVAGVIIGVFTAPCKGKETRKKVADSAESLRKVIVGFRNKTGNSVEDVKQLLRQEIEGLEPNVRQQILKIIESGTLKSSHN